MDIEELELFSAAEGYAKEMKNIRLFGQSVCRNISIEERQEDAFIAGARWMMQKIEEKNSGSVK